MELHFFVTLAVPAIVYCRQWRTHINKPSVLLFTEGVQICFLLLEIKKDVMYRRGRALLIEGAKKKKKTLYCSSFNFVEESKTLMRFLIILQKYA